MTLPSASSSSQVLEEASVLFALAQVLLQKAKAEPLTDQSMIDVFKWLKQVGVGRTWAEELVPGN